MLYTYVQVKQNRDNPILRTQLDCPSEGCRWHSEIHARPPKHGVRIMRLNQLLIHMICTQYSRMNSFKWQSDYDPLTDQHTTDSD
jgi:hypothetical protein